MDKSLILNKIKEYLNIRFDKDFANYLGIKTTTLAMWYSRNTYDVELLFKKCEFLNSEWLLTGEGSMLKSKSLKKPHTIDIDKQVIGIPMLPFDAFAGIGDSSITGVNFDTIEERYVVPLFDGIKIDFMIPVRGSSMYPKYSSGDVVACRLIDELLFIQWNKVYVIDSNSQGVIMKRLLKGDDNDHIICRSDNKDYDDFNVPMTDIRSIAIIVGVIRLE